MSTNKKMRNSPSSSSTSPTSSRRAISLLASPRTASWCWCVVAGSRWDQDTRTPGYAGRQAAQRHRRTRSSSLLSRSRAPKGGALLVTRRCTSPSRRRRCHLKLCACRAWCARRRCLYRPSVFSAGAWSRAVARSRGRAVAGKRRTRAARGGSLLACGLFVPKKHTSKEADCCCCSEGERALAASLSAALAGERGRLTLRSLRSLGGIRGPASPS